MKKTTTKNIYIHSGKAHSSMTPVLIQVFQPQSSNEHIHMYAGVLVPTKPSDGYEKKKKKKKELETLTGWTRHM